MPSQKLKPIVIDETKHQVLHEMMHKLIDFKDHLRYCPCMPRDRAKCQEIADTILLTYGELVK